MNSVNTNSSIDSGTQLKFLGQMTAGMRGVIYSISFRNADLASRLLEIGFLEGSSVEVIHEAPISHDPIVVRIRGTLIALRRSEANLIQVIPV